MKKILLLFTLFACLFSCSDDDNNPDDSLWEIKLVTNIQEDQTEVKLEVQGIKYIDWGNGSKKTNTNSITHAILYDKGNYTITIKGQGEAILICSNCHLTSLDVSKCPELALLNCTNNQLTSIDLGKTLKLIALYCAKNRLNSLDVNTCFMLKQLHCSENLLTSINLGNIFELKHFTCHYNQLKSIDLNSCHNLLEVGCADNQLTSLNLSQCKKLVALVCIENQITTLDLSQCDNISEIFCRDNAFNKESMNTFFNSLPDRTDKEEGTIILHYDKSIGDISIAKNKNWIIQ